MKHTYHLLSQHMQELGQHIILSTTNFEEEQSSFAFAIEKIEETESITLDSEQLELWNKNYSLQIGANVYFIIDQSEEIFYPSLFPFEI